MNDLATRIQKRCEEIWDENYGESKPKTVKAILAAMFSGAIDGVIISFPIMFISLLFTCITNAKNISKKEDM